MIMFVAKSKKDWPFLNQKPLEYFNTNYFFFFDALL